MDYFLLFLKNTQVITALPSDNRNKVNCSIMDATNCPILHFAIILRTWEHISTTL